VIVWPDGSVTGSVNVAELEEIEKARKGMSAKKLAAIGPVESLAQLLAGPPDEPKPEPESGPEASEAAPEAPTTKKGS